PFHSQAHESRLQPVGPPQDRLKPGLQRTPTRPTRNRPKGNALSRELEGLAPSDPRSGAGRSSACHPTEIDRESPSSLSRDLAASEHLADYLRRPPMRLFLWLRGIAGNTLLELHRRHLGTPMRDARREVSLHRGALPGATSAALAAQLLGQQTRPSEAAVRAE